MSQKPRHGIEHIIVLMLENRSFDHLFGFLNHPDDRLPNLDKLVPKPEWPAFDGGVPVAPTPTATVVIEADPSHEHKEVLRQIFGTPKQGKLDQAHMRGFIDSYATKVEGNEEAASRIMECFADSPERVLSVLAKQFAVMSRWHSSVPGETWPNRNFAHAATSGGKVDIELDFYDDLTIFEQLNEEDSAIYHHGVPQALAFRKLWWGDRRQFWSMDDLWDALDPDKDAKLPKYSFIEPNHGLAPGFGPGDSQHPANNTEGVSPGTSFVGGERLIARVYNALYKNKDLFDRTLLLITYDEHGGLYDHVPPQKVDPPDHQEPELNFGFDICGIRVPTVVVSPLIKRAALCDKFFEHSSIPATVRNQFVPAADHLTARSAAAADFIDELANGGAIVKARPPSDLPPLFSPLPEPPDSTEVKRVLNTLQSKLMKLGSSVKRTLEHPPDPDHPGIAPAAPLPAAGPMKEAADAREVVTGSAADREVEELMNALHGRRG